MKVTSPQETAVQFVKGVGPKLAQKLSRLGIETVWDLVFYFPYRYEDRRRFWKISELSPSDGVCQIKAQLIHLDLKRSWRRGIRLLRTLFKDDTGTLLVLWFNQDYLADKLKVGEEYILYGRLMRAPYGGLEMVNPEITPQEKAEELTAIVPVYSLGSIGLSQRQFRKIVRNALETYGERFEDILKEVTCKEKGNLPSIQDALRELHFPSDEARLAKARERLVFEEFFRFSLELERRKRYLRKDRTRRFSAYSNEVVRYFVSRLNFELTSAQKRAIEELLSDFRSNKIMHRLLQGDVGSGKTVVAFYVASVVLGSGYQVAFMVPTEILAQQHYAKAKSLFPEDRIELLTASTKKKERERILHRLANKEPIMVIGTHSLIQEDVPIPRLGLAIIDEQHRFGVNQRMELARKAPDVDVLVMTATPIPRSLAMTLYGDLDLTVIDELPPGRKPVKTLWITSDKRERLYRFMREQVEAGGQVYVIYPLVEESEDVDLLAAEQMYAYLKNEVFPDIEVGLVHGKMSASEKKRVMDDFFSGKVKILVATVVVEVGIDVPNATVMVIEHAERFGLSQLHQLRGRIGRGDKEAYCIVVSDSENEKTRRRLGAFVKYPDGFKLSEIDLLLRGPGEFSGQRQHGPSEFKVGNPIVDFPILQRARRCAEFWTKQNEK